MEIPSVDWPMTATLLPLGISAAIGLLIGLQRERASSALAGIRTFPLIALFGTLIAIIVEQLGRRALPPPSTDPTPSAANWAGPVIIGAGFIAVAAMIVVGNLNAAAARYGRPSASTDAADDEKIRGGITTEMAVLIVYALGVYVYLGDAAIAGIVGVSVAVLLNAKKYLHGLVGKLGEKDVVGILQFAVVTFVILPILPDETMGPMHVLNPRQIWYLVVLVVGMSLAGYIAYKFLASRYGLVVAGLLGGLVSSTAITASYSRLAGDSKPQRLAALLVILLASAVLYARVLVLVGVVASGALPEMAAPIGIMLGCSLGVAFACWLFVRKQKVELPEQSNPSQLIPALIFGCVYAVVLLATAYAKEKVGATGIYTVAAISGSTDMDAITLSVARMANDASHAASAGADAVQHAADAAASGNAGGGDGVAETMSGVGITAATAWRAILIAAASNMVFKVGIAAFLGGRRLALWLAGAFAILIAVTGVLVAVW